MGKDKVRTRIKSAETSDYDSLEKGEIYTKAKPFTVEELGRKKRRSWLKFLDKHKGKSVLIKMEMGNGQFREFLTADEGGFFIFNKSLYVFDYSLKYYIIERDIWAYDFNEFMSIPLRKKFQITEQLEKFLQPNIDSQKRRPLNPKVDINEIRTLVENSDIIDVEASLNPSVLKRFTDSEVIKQVLQGTMLGRIFKVMFVLIIIIAVFMLLILILMLYQSGIFGTVIESLNPK